MQVPKESCNLIHFDIRHGILHKIRCVSQSSWNCPNLNLQTMLLLQSLQRSSVRQRSRRLVSCSCYPFQRNCTTNKTASKKWSRQQRKTMNECQSMIEVIFITVYRGNWLARSQLLFQSSSSAGGRREAPVPPKSAFTTLHFVSRKRKRFYFSPDDS